MFVDLEIDVNDNVCPRCELAKTEVAVDEDAVDEDALRATFRDGEPDVRAALKHRFPAITFTVTKTVPMTRALEEVSIGQWFKSSFGTVYQRIGGYLKEMLVQDAERLYVVSRDGIVDYYRKSSGDAVVTLTDRDGTPLTEEKEEVF